jgi:hypothetical protein
MPFITESGLWLQWDYAAGPMLAGHRVVLFVTSSRAMALSPDPDHDTALVAD